MTRHAAIPLLLALAAGPILGAAAASANERTIDLAPPPKESSKASGHASLEYVGKEDETRLHVDVQELAAGSYAVFLTTSAPAGERRAGTLTVAKSRKGEADFELSGDQTAFLPIVLRDAAGTVVLQSPLT